MKQTVLAIIRNISRWFQFSNIVDFSPHGTLWNVGYNSERHKRTNLHRSGKNSQLWDRKLSKRKGTLETDHLTQMVIQFTPKTVFGSPYTKCLFNVFKITKMYLISLGIRIEFEILLRLRGNIFLKVHFYCIFRWFGKMTL